MPELKSHNASGADIRRELRGTPESRVSPRSEFELREVDNGTGGTDLKVRRVRQCDRCGRCV